MEQESTKFTATATQANGEERNSFGYIEYGIFKKRNLQEYLTSIGVITENANGTTTTRTKDVYKEVKPQPITLNPNLTDYYKKLKDRV